MRTLREIWAYARSPKVIIPPSPDQLAVAFGSALLASGKYNDSPDAAIIAAWTVVPAFYEGRAMYTTKIAPMHFAVTMPAAGPVAWMQDDDGEEYTVRAGHDAEPVRI